MKGVFDVSGQSKYNDRITEHYHFPSIYLTEAQKLVGDWIVYRETRAAGGRMAYIAVALVQRIDPDPVDPTHYYARVRRYLDFDEPVPYRDQAGRFAESFLRDMDRPSDAGRTLRGASIRTIGEIDFAAIIEQGLKETLDPSNRARLGLDPYSVDHETEVLLLETPANRRIEAVLTNRKIRDASFRNQVLAAYDSTCAVTGLKIVNGGGRAEAQAAHIWPVAEGGPDTIQNGVALSATAHWLFDRYLITFDDDFGLLVSHNKVPLDLQRLFPPSGQRIHLPRNPNLYPRADYVAGHRDRFASAGLA